MKRTGKAIAEIAIWTILGFASGLLMTGMISFLSWENPFDVPQILYVPRFLALLGFVLGIARVAKIL